MAKIRLNTQALAGSLTNTEVNATAAIAYTKLDLATSLKNSDWSAVSSNRLAYTNLDLSTSLKDGDWSAVATDKLAEAKVAFDTSAGHSHNGVDSKLIAVVGNTYNSVPEGTVNGVNTLFTFSPTPAGYMALFLNGVMQIPTTDYTHGSAGSIVTFAGTNIPVAGDSILAHYNS